MGGFGRGLGGPGEALGASGGALGASWEALGPLLGAPWVEDQNLIDFGVDLGSQKWPQEGPKMDPKMVQNRHRNLTRYKMLSKTLLEPSWVDLGSSWVPSWSQNRAPMQGGARFFENRLFEENEASRGDLGRTWANLGAQKGPKWSPRGSQDRTKSDTKNDQKKASILGRFCGAVFFEG